MKEICEHIIDIVNNSIAAGTTIVEIEIRVEKAKDKLFVMIRDNGKGIDPHLLQNISDPFFTSKLKKKIGMGTSLLKFHAELSGGEFSIQSEPGIGTRVLASFGLSHIDRQPLGDLSGTLLMFLTANPKVRLIYKHLTENGSFGFDSAEIVDALGGVPLNRPEVRSCLKEFLSSNLDVLLENRKYD